MIYLGIEFDVNSVRKSGSFNAVSELQQATVQFRVYPNGSIMARHCGFGSGCFYTEFKTIVESWE